MADLKDNWGDGNPYEYFMGRWSKLIAPHFLTWLDPKPSLKWLDIGCGTAALSEVIYNTTNPISLTGIDPSEGFIELAKRRIKQVDFQVGDALNLPFNNLTFDTIVSGLAINFFPDLHQSLIEMQRVSKKDACIAAYVWDYSGKMEFLRYFWDAASSLDKKANAFDEGLRFPICSKENLENAFSKAGLKEIVVDVIDIETLFTSFNDYWNPFLGGQGPAPAYLASINEVKRSALKNKLYDSLTFETDGSIKLIGRALAVKGKSK